MRAPTPTTATPAPMPALAPELSPEEEELEDVEAARELVEDTVLSAANDAEIVEVKDEVWEPPAELVAELVVEEVVAVEASVILTY